MMDKMDDREWFIQRCLVLEQIIKNAIPENYSAKEISSVLANMLKQQISLTLDPHKSKENFLRFLKD